MSRKSEHRILNEGQGASDLSGFAHLRGYFAPDAQRALIEDVAAVIEAAPLYRPVMPRSGRPLSVLMTNCGALGWISDRAGYRYVAAHPVTGEPWPAIPAPLLDLWRDVAAGAAEPEACLVNCYAPGARLGLHRDEDEEDFSAPVVSVSLGDAGLFRIGGLARRDPARALRLGSGDVVLLGGGARLAYHAITRIEAGSSTLLDRRRDLFPQGGRINLTLRRVRRAPG